MKSIRKFKVLLWLLIIGALTSRCGEPKKFDPINLELTGSMQARINGLDWNSKLNTTFILDKTRSKMVISGFENTVDEGRLTITLTVNALTEGAYSSPAATASYTNSKAEDSWISSECLVEVNTIDEVQKLATGTFSFTARSVKDNSVRTISGGTFKNIPLVIE